MSYPEASLDGEPPGSASRPTASTSSSKNCLTGPGRSGAKPYRRPQDGREVALTLYCDRDVSALQTGMGVRAVRGPDGRDPRRRA